METLQQVGALPPNLVWDWTKGLPGSCQGNVSRAIREYRAEPPAGCTLVSALRWFWQLLRSSQAVLWRTHEPEPTLWVATMAIFSHIHHETTCVVTVSIVTVKSGTADAIGDPGLRPGASVLLAHARHAAGESGSEVPVPVVHSTRSCRVPRRCPLRLAALLHSASQQQARLESPAPDYPSGSHLASERRR